MGRASQAKLHRRDDQRDERRRELLDEDRLVGLAKAILNRPQFEQMMGTVSPFMRAAVRARIWPLLHAQVRAEIPEVPEGTHVPRPS